jgi:hypothetical protein
MGARLDVPKPGEFTPGDEVSKNPNGPLLYVTRVEWSDGVQIVWCTFNGNEIAYNSKELILRNRCIH